MVARIRSALDEKELYIDQERKGKKRRVDVRPLIERMGLREGEGGGDDVGRWGIELALRSEEGRTAKPLEIVERVLELKGESLSRCKILKVE